jgi:hypothetical protein
MSPGPGTNVIWKAISRYRKSGSARDGGTGAGWKQIANFGTADRSVEETHAWADRFDGAVDGSNSRMEP